MLNHTASVYLRYVLLINALAALLPATSVKGRANDPLLHSTWWTFEQHSAVLVVALAAVLGTALTFAVVRKNLRSTWALMGCGLAAGEFPATFYLVAAPSGTELPLADMYVAGAISGVIGGFVLIMVLRVKKSSEPA
jgi:drug/metabolite transporter superfamily protein YnfA